MEYTEKILKNGLVFKTYNNAYLNSVTIGLYINAGLLYEDKNYYGVSHLLEHLYFRRMADLTQSDLYYKMERMGSSLRGTTYKNCICFCMTVLPEYVKDALEIFYSIFTHSQWDESDIFKEKRVVLNQIEYQSREDFYQYLDRKYFAGTGLDHQIMGRQSTIKKLTKNTIHSNKNYFINPANACMVLTGNFDSEELAHTLEEFSILKNHNGLLEKSVMISRFGERTQKDTIITDIDWDTSEVFISFDIPSKTDIYGARVLCSILGEGVGSRLPLLLREELGLTNAVYSQMEEYNGIKRMYIKFVVANCNLKVALEEAFFSISNLKFEVRQREFECAKIFHTENKRFLYDDTKELNFTLGYYGFINKEDLGDIKEMISQYKHVDLEKLTAAANRIFSKNNLFLGVSNNAEIIAKTQINKILSELRNSL